LQVLVEVTIAIKVAPVLSPAPFYISSLTYIRLSIHRVTYSVYP
jgi:hypothetical protein